MAKAGLHLEVPCLICGTIYRQSRNTQMYCSGKCASIAWRNKNYHYTKLSCKKCSANFIRKHSHQRYCSKECQKEAERKKKKVIGGLGKGWSKGTKISIESIFKATETKMKNGTLQNMNRANASWKAAWRTIGTTKKYFRSRWEANFARYLEWLKNQNEIIKWEHEPETFWFHGVKRGCVSYLPDFRVTEKNGEIVFYEVKGWMDARSKTKIKRMAKYHPQIKLIVIESKAYKQLSKQLNGLIPEWE